MLAFVLCLVVLVLFAGEFALFLVSLSGSVFLEGVTNICFFPSMSQHLFEL